MLSVFMSAMTTDDGLERLNNIDYQADKEMADDAPAEELKRRRRGGRNEVDGQRWEWTRKPRREGAAANSSVEHVGSSVRERQLTNGERSR
jgi:hypothetical protein